MPADAYNHTDSEFLKSENNQNRDAGSTASTAILVGDRLLVANVGDSRAVICRGGNAFAVSRDHKPDQSDERQRIEDAGGFVMWAGADLHLAVSVSELGEWEVSLLFLVHLVTGS
ncbi:hypothetical protein Goari_004513 [Gossypium aridum]|uniref:PPM-type phosphatase domain-containing protein n=1 Tax=Gossypium aridum TaxID=34290 RepID=A0A7J8Y562_GOSAI|nr:hypothetical protein [Gossypium aridum]